MDSIKHSASLTLQFDGERRITNLLGQSAGFFRGVENLVVEDREVERQTQPNRVCGLHLRRADVQCFLVRPLRLFYRAYSACTHTHKKRKTGNMRSSLHTTWISNRIPVPKKIHKMTSASLTRTT